ncbi:MAG: hypothetical protein BGN88_00090 [Clostridiales bacterium 43-6]|nr:MAG: hypothetical protein BGN88_00090 [Clostridiales bacterium 43-6]
MELRRLAQFLEDDEEAFAEMLEQKNNKDILAKQKQTESTLQKAIARNDEVAKLYERLYEDNVNGKVTDEWFMQLSYKYEVERMELKEKITALREKLISIGAMKSNKDHFIGAVRKFMEMQMLTAPLLRELIDHIDVHQIEGIGKNRTQRIVIHYRFVGIVETPAVPKKEHIKLDTRQGVAVEYIQGIATA